MKYSNAHLISNHGRVKNKEMGIILNPKPTPYVCFRIPTTTKNILVHRIVIETFSDDKHKSLDPNYVVNHKSGVKYDNHISNLEFLTHAQNIKHAHDNGLAKTYKRAIVQLDKETGSVIREFDSAKDIQDELGFICSYVTAVCRGKRKSAYGYGWRYKFDTEFSEWQSTLTGEVWKSISEENPHLQISDSGRIRNVKKKKLLMGTRDPHGYLRSKYGFLHVLVAKAFIPNDDVKTKTQVDHIDKNRSNNHVSNLRWVTPQENTEYACGKRVIQCDPVTGKVLNEYKSIQKAARAVNCSATSIERYIKNERKTSAGYVFKYADGQPTKKRKRDSTD